MKITKEALVERGFLNKTMKTVCRLEYKPFCSISVVFKGKKNIGVCVCERSLDIDEYCQKQWTENTIWLPNCRTMDDIDDLIRLFVKPS